MGTCLLLKHFYFGVKTSFEFQTFLALG